MIGCVVFSVVNPLRTTQPVHPTVAQADMRGLDTAVLVSVMWAWPRSFCVNQRCFAVTKHRRGSPTEPGCAVFRGFLDSCFRKRERINRSKLVGGGCALHAGDIPNEGRQLASDRDDSHRLRFTACHEAAEASAQAKLSVPRACDDGLIQRIMA